MKKEFLKHTLGVKTDYALAKLLGVTPSGVYQWGENIPPERWKQAVALAKKHGVTITTEEILQ